MNGPLPVQPLDEAQWPQAVALLALAMRDNPLHVAVFGSDPVHREQRLQRLFRSVLGHVWHQGFLFGVSADGELQGLMGMLAPGGCQPGLVRRLSMGLRFSTSYGPATNLRLYRWLSGWAQQDPTVPHWHLGPLAVHPAARRRGLGRRLMQAACDRADAQGSPAWLETDLWRNVLFYRSLGFVVQQERSVLGVPNWFMWRDPRSG